MWTRNHTRWVVLCWVVMTLIGCSCNSGSRTTQHSEGETLAAASDTPAFRSLGKRGESAL